MNYKKFTGLVKKIFDKKTDDVQAEIILKEIKQMIFVDKVVINRLIDQIESDTGHKLSELLRKERLLKLKKLNNIRID